MILKFIFINIDKNITILIVILQQNTGINININSIEKIDYFANYLCYAGKLMLRYPENWYFCFLESVDYRSFTAKSLWARIKSDVSEHYGFEFDG